MSRKFGHTILKISSIVVAARVTHATMTSRDLKSFGYGFNEDGQLRQLDEAGKLTDRVFKYEVKPGDREYNQKNYEDLGDVITEYVYTLLETDCGLLRVPLPKDVGREGDAPRSFVFVSPGYEEKENLLVLIHGSGVVRAGQWARKLIINNSLKEGTQIEFIKKAMGLDYGVIVFNTNDNVRNKQPIPKCTGPEEHGMTVWADYVQATKAKRIAIIAHSYGGVVTLELAKEFQEDFLSRVFSVLLTDSVHSFGFQKPSPSLVQRLKEIGLNYVASDKPLNEDIRRNKDDIPAVSAGHTTHEWTSWSAFEAIFKKLEEQRILSKQKSEL